MEREPLLQIAQRPNADALGSMEPSIQARLLCIAVSCISLIPFVVSVAIVTGLTWTLPTEATTMCEGSLIWEYEATSIIFPFVFCFLSLLSGRGLSNVIILYQTAMCAWGMAEVVKCFNTTLSSTLLFKMGSIVEVLSIVYLLISLVGLCRHILKCLIC
jgi:hypothetical protein